jgi:hypothetical protein
MVKGGQPLGQRIFTANKSLDIDLVAGQEAQGWGKGATTGANDVDFADDNFG